MISWLVVNVGMNDLYVCQISLTFSFPNGNSSSLVFDFLPRSPFPSYPPHPLVEYTV